MRKTIIISLLLFFKVNFFLAQQKVDSIKAVLSKNIHDTTRLRNLNALAYEISYSNPDTAIIINKQAYTLGEKLVSETKLNSENLPLWFAAKMGVGSSLIILGTITKEQGNFSDALLNYDKSLAVWREIEKNVSDKDLLKLVKGQVAICDGKIGGVYRHQGNYPKALEHYFKALKWSEETNNKLNSAVWLGNIGITHGEQGNTEKSLEYYLKALAAFKELGHETGIATANMNIAGAYQEFKNYKKALEYYQTALEAFTKMGYKSHMAPTLGNIGGTYFNMKDYTKALDYYLQALKMEEELGNKEGVGRHMCNLGALYTATGNFKEAEKYNRKSLEIAEETGSADDIKDAHKNLADLFSKTNRWQEAFKHHEKYSALKDSLFSEEKNKDATKREMTYEFEKKEALVKAEQEKKDAVVQEEMQKQTLQRNAFIGGFALMLVLAVVIYRSYRNKRKAHEIIAAQKVEVEQQKELVMEKNKEITDSIHYALRIQNALLATEESLKENLTGHFILFQPKDIVSGDFYWAVEHNKRFYLAVCDSTGHGVPGAFMSLLNMGFLSEAIKEKDIVQPNEILDYVRRRLVQTVSKGEQKDGMDGILLCFDKNNDTISYAAAHNSPVLISARGLENLKADKMPIGNSERYDPFTLHMIPVSKGDLIYLYTDGYADQFGGPKARVNGFQFGQGKKFKYKQLEDVLLNNCGQSLNRQKDILERTLNDWKGSLEQVDDICVIGIKI
ncbi:MAG: protein serine/threonine phosphatase [Bacteroidetes bacterium]|jgi:serine phosphatase RsbU (regulator of sigma subunit)|nr:protein serine/threonine phosphatase [Bacteroidota bacterium]